VSGDFKVPVTLENKGVYFVRVIDVNFNSNITKRIIVQ
jgi:hypothetical protein